MSFLCRSSDENERPMLRQARILIEDAENYRSINHKLDKHSLIMYDVSHSFYLTLLHRASLVIMFLLPFFEWPSSLTVSSDIRLKLEPPNLPCGVTEGVELLCLLFISVQSILLSGAFGLSWVRVNPWLIGKYIFLIIYLLDLIVSLSFRCSEFYRIRRLIRPYFLISSSQLMKKVIKCYRRTLPTLFNLLFLLLFWLISATLVAMCVFSKPNRDLTNYNVVNNTSTTFTDFYDTLFNLLVLLTTTNHPDILIPPYNKNRGTAIFSIVYIGVGLYVLMNILTAAVYSEFSGYLMSSVQTRLMRRRVATRAAFEVLKYEHNGIELVSGDDVVYLINTIRIETWKKDTMRQVYLMKYSRANLNAKQFMKLFQLLDLLGPSNQSIPEQVPRHRLARIFKTLIMSKGFELVRFFISVLNVIYLCVDISYSLSTGKYPGVIMRIISWCFVIFYVFEQISFLWAYGQRAYFSKKSNIFGIFIVAVILIVKLVELTLLLTSRQMTRISYFRMTIWDIVRLSNILLLTRTTRLIVLFPWTRLVVNVLTDLPTNLAPVLGILVSAFYFYALLGMNLFSDVIKYRNSTNSSKPEIYECGTYQELQYWSINFNDFAASLVLLWDLMVVNNWQIIVIAYTQAVNRWVHVYMISWWLFVVVGILSLTTAFIIESFLHRHDLQPKKSVYENKSLKITRNNTSDFEEPISHSINRASSSNNNYAEGDDDESSKYKSTHLLVSSLSFLRRRSSAEMISITLDEIFRCKLQEPSEESIIAEIYSHPYFQNIIAL
ncbi:Two pore calcium channel protein 2 [Schistosoma japonicum]|uniref:Two-pore calcium channel protein 2 (Voltage-dependent calcium channel protein TPC2) n=4 Tax=Schistosoma japonicum TaxID=6182 RepID=C7TXY9_SCHJA|nr:Two pore calcium channel protein 2 [Schistosoma japonicum]CAX82465.1 Two-pore calcium channel protein 2 (Voltage-dependent calcium channel protein TPC2) [Schistosoma japonicum]